MTLDHFMDDLRANINKHGSCQMIIDQIKYQHMQGTKDDIYRLHREIAELRNELSTSWSMAKQRRPQAPKQRNFIAKSVRDPEGPFRPRVIKNKIKNKKWN